MIIGGGLSGFGGISSSPDRERIALLADAALGLGLSALFGSVAAIGLGVCAVSGRVVEPRERFFPRL